MSNKLEFRVSSALKNIVGKDLIVNDYIAIFELVKNSFDARATHVIITFDEDSISIADNGKGMTLDDIKNKWLFLAYSAKKDGKEDVPKEEDFRDKIRERRYYAGAKGIGRFSSDRLGKELTLTTKTKNSGNCEQIFVDWTKFEKDQEKEFVEISVDHTNLGYSTELFPEKSTHGTILKISRLNDTWPSLKLRNLRRSLEKLINPFSGKSSFSIEIICEKEIEEDKVRTDSEKINGILKNTILDALNQKTTRIDVEISSTDIITEIIDRGISIYKIREPNFENLLTGTSISLLFLNRSARHTFTLRMGIQSVEYGSVFLYKNGFRIYPYGEPGDDSWGIDARKQQGYNRYLGSRDLIGKVEIQTNLNEEFKETSSRDGGLVQTRGAILLHEAFDNAHRRLERYVVGVLWGEGFMKRDFFIDDKIATEYRSLLSKDKDSDDITTVQSNLGSKLDFIQIVKGLVKDRNVEVLGYNEDLTKLIVEELNTVKIDVLKDIEEIAIKTGNESLKEEVEKIAIALQEEIAKREKAQREAEEAERRLQEEIAKREKAQQEAEEAKKARDIAEENRKKEEIAKKEAELKQKEAEQKAREEKLRRKEEELKREEEERKRKYAEAQKAEAENKLEIEKDKNTYLSATRHLTKEVEDIIHTIKISSNELKSSVKNIRDQVKDNKAILEDLAHINFHIDRVNKLSSLLTKADISFLKEHVKIDIPSYIEEYISNYSVSISNIKFIKDFSEPFIRKVSSLDLSVILDNIISNSKKAGATEMLIEFSKRGSHLNIDFSDNGDGVPDNFIKNDALFELGVTNRRGGSGIGLSAIKERLNKNLYGDIIFVGNNHKLKGATFRITF
ncbi:ATP-binding protein [Dysgonomonas massiliensis]|uniref:ATP-binding protein n=1 Tax=Dysgonomonas massiliensis TaxID=2040292 RepID=UPI000C7710AE|nr:ATP-binding protein [Dysgonomonas massiliensis]